MPLVEIPEPRQQTDMRRAVGYWIAGVSRPSGETSLSTWLVRSPAEMRWHGIWTDVPTGDMPLTRLMRATYAIMGILPRFTDTIAVWQPKNNPDVHHTTFVETFIGQGLPRATLPGIELGLFPLNELPLKDMRPAEARLAPEPLRQATEEGMSPNRVEILPDGRQMVGPDLD